MSDDQYADLQTKHRMLGGPLDGDPIFDDRLPQIGDEKIHDTERCEHTYKFDGRVWQHESVKVLRGWCPEDVK